MVSFVQLFLLFPFTHLDTSTTIPPAVECPVEENANYTIKGKRTYPHAIYYSCNGCNGQETFGFQYCRQNGSRDGEALPNCTASCLNSRTTCLVGWNLNCVFYPRTNWELCGKSCDTPALCHRESGETDCECGYLAQKGRCENNENIRVDICPYTCSLRENITCGEPNGFFPNAVAKITRTAHWMDTTWYTCLDGYINMGQASWIACNMTGRWILHTGINPIHCIPEGYYGTFRVTVKDSVRLEHINTTEPVTETVCARMCARDTRCTHFTCDEDSVCQSYMYPRWKSTGEKVTKKPLWQKILPTEYNPDVKLP